MRAFIQVDLDAMNLYPRVAMMAGFGVEHVHRGLNEVWAHCYRAKVGELPAAFLRSFFPESGQVITALIVCGFIAQLDGDRLRVRGIARRYEKDYNARAEAGRKGGQKTAAKLDRDGGRFTKQTPSKERKQDAFPPSHQANTVGLVESPTDVSEDPEPGVCVLTKQTKQTTKQTTKPPSKPPSDAWSAWPSHQADPKSNSLSPKERETIENGAPAVRSADATPLEAGREPRQEQPPEPSPNTTYRLWTAADLGPAPPDDEWAKAAVWRGLQLATRRHGDNEVIMRVMAQEELAECARVMEPLCEGSPVGLMVLSQLDDMLASGRSINSRSIAATLRDMVHAAFKAEPDEPIEDEPIDFHAINEVNHEAHQLH